MKKYVKKPVRVEAIQLTRNYVQVVADWIGKENIKSMSLGEFPEDACYIDIRTLEGVITASEGDYIVKGIKGEFYPVKPDIFHLSYYEYTLEAGVPYEQN